MLAGKIGFTARSSCMPAGVPAFMNYAGPTPLYFIQTPKEVWMIFSGDHEVRRVYMDVPIQKIRNRPGMASRSATTKAIHSSSIPLAKTQRPSFTVTARHTPTNCMS